MHGARPTLCSTTAESVAICSSTSSTATPKKQGRFTPGTRIPIREPKSITRDRPDVVLGLPWNLETELREQLSYIAEWGGELVFPPSLRIEQVGVQRHRSITGMSVCRGCGGTGLSRVLDVGKVPAADQYPLATEPVRSEESSHLLSMDLCTLCGLAQPSDDDTVTAEPRGIEPQALRDQAACAVKRVADAG